MPSAGQERAFWQDLGHTLRYPLQGEAGLVLLGLTLARILGYLPVAGFVINLLLTVALYKYGFEVLKASADGEAEAPMMRRDVPDGAGWAQIGLQFVFMAAAVAGYLHLPLIPWLVLLSFLCVLYPAALMLLAMTESFLEAVNPARLLEVWQRMGGAYLLLAGLILAIRFVELLVQVTFVPLVPVGSGLLEHFVGGWTALVCYRLLGKSIHQYRDAFEYEPEPLPEPLARARMDPDQAILDQAQALHAERGAAEAAKLLHAHLQARGGSDAVHQRCREWLREADDQSALLEHARLYLNVLVANERFQDVPPLLAECQTLDKRFQPASPELVHELAKLAEARGQRNSALLLLNAFLQANGDHPHVPRNGLLAARLLAHSVAGVANARRLLGHLQARYPRHSLREEIDALLTDLSQASPAGSSGTAGKQDSA